MKMQMICTNPDEVVFSLTMTMTLKEWREFQGQLTHKWPSWGISSQIGDMVMLIERVYYPKEPANERE